MKLTIIAIFLLAVSSISTAAPTVIADSANIISVGNATGNDDNFFIYVKGGTGTCTNTLTQKLIVFPLSASGGNKEIHARSYSAVLAAYMSGKLITVTNYQDFGCNNASKVKIINEI
jgi:hypothetical protein